MTGQLKGTSLTSMVLKVIEPGGPAPSLTLQNLDNQSIELSETWSHGSNSLLVFLRHLG